MNNNNGINRIAMSGTYSTGKTVTTEALSHLTGIGRTYAKTMRELLPLHFPGKKLEECNIFDLYELGMLRFVERVSNEGGEKKSYITDGSVIHEYIYGMSRMNYGLAINNEHPIKKFMTNIKLLPHLRVYKGISERYGNIVKKYAKSHYDIFIHLPIEFPMVKDGHRPYSEEFREMCDRKILNTLEEMEIPYIIAKGTIEERLKTIVETLNLETVTSYEEAARVGLEKAKKNA